MLEQGSCVALQILAIDEELSELEQRQEVLRSQRRSLIAGKDVLGAVVEQPKVSPARALT